MDSAERTKKEADVSRIIQSTICYELLGRSIFWAVARQGSAHTIRQEKEVIY